MAARHRIAFSVDTIEPIEGDGVRIGGRCYEGPIRRGDAFVVLLGISVHKSADAYITEDAREKQGVSFRVEAIKSYGFQLEELDAGLTGELLVSGDDSALLSPGRVLGGESKDSTPL